MAINKKQKIWDGPSKSDQYLENRDNIPQVSALMSKHISAIRRDSLSAEVDKGLFKDGSGPNINDIGATQNSHVLSSIGLKKYAQVVSGGAGAFRGGSGDTVKQTPEVYSPLWLNSNLNLPRDRATINAWCRSFYALNPFVHNAINLHSTYPISKLNIKCPNKDIEKFFNDMIEEIDLMNICVQIAQEYWLLGESFVYAELDESKGKWSRLLIQNPDYMIVKRTVVANEPIIMLRPDANLEKIIFSNKPSDIEQRKQLNQHIIDSVKRGQNIPLDNFHVHHLARKISPYEIRGTGLPVCIFRQLMLFDKLRECHDDQTEVLTDKGFKKITDLVHQTTDLAPDPNYVNGVELDQDGKITSILTMKEDFKVACVNPENNNVEYHKPIELHMSKYTGEMLHFTGKHVNSLVTPNHKMWAKKRNGNEYGNFEKIKASDFCEKGVYKFQAKANWNNGKEVSEINVLGNNVPVDIYLKYLGYTISEGCVDTCLNKKTQQYRNRTSITQSVESPFYLNMRETTDSFASFLNKNVCHEIKDNSNNGNQNLWSGTICSKDLNKYLFDQIGINNKCDSFNKKIPEWILHLSKSHLQVLLAALVDGDGSRKIIDNNTVSYRYTTVSEELANNIQELVFKCGYSVFISKDKRPNKSSYEYTVRWSDSEIGSYPTVCNSDTQKAAKINKVNYDGIVWCFEVPTGLFITRRGNRISIHGNSKYAQADNMINPLTIVKIGSAEFKPTFADLEAWRNVFEEAQYDKDFKIFTHEGVTVERVGYGQGIYDISGDITQIIKEIYVGLQVPPVLMDGGADTTYANGGVALDVLRQRYMQFRNMMSTWLKRKIFAPISKIQGFYDYSNGEKQLIVPDIDWNHMSLFDAGDYINNLVNLTQGPDAEQKRASLHTLYRSMGLEFEDEVRKIRKESIQSAIFRREKAALEKMDLHALRSLDEEDEIPEPIGEALTEAPLPGEQPGGMPGAPPGGGMPGLDLGGPGGMSLPPPLPLPSAAENAPSPPPAPSPEPPPV
jgi:hypothetical protein